MKRTLKTAIAAIFTLTISLSLVYFFLVEYEYVYTTTKWEANFYLSEFDTSKKIILIVGSSQVFAINMTYVNEEISKVCSGTTGTTGTNEAKSLSSPLGPSGPLGLKVGADCIVYNLGKVAESPQLRLRELHLLKNIEPDLVFYGISYRDFANLKKTGEEFMQIKTPKSFLPDPQDFFKKEVLFKMVKTEINPKLFSLKFLKGELLDEKSNVANVPNPNRPIFLPSNLDIHTSNGAWSLNAYSNEELEKNKGSFERATQLAKINPYVSHKNVNALKTIIAELKNNEIEVVIFTAPLPQVFLDKVSNSDKELFTNTINDLSKEFNVPIYRLDEKFSEKDIWLNHWHITMSEKGLVYAEEIVKIIKTELNNNAL